MIQCTLVIALHIGDLTENIIPLPKPDVKADLCSQFQAFFCSLTGSGKITCAEKVVSDSESLEL